MSAKQCAQLSDAMSNSTVRRAEFGGRVGSLEFAQIGGSPHSKVTLVRAESFQQQQVIREPLEGEH